MNHTPRLRVFAGPNGSGKSTVKRTVELALQNRGGIGLWINADEIGAAFKAGIGFELWPGIGG